jgi:hypothetical protein
MVGMAADMINASMAPKKRASKAAAMINVRVFGSMTWLVDAEFT